jgi:aminopeptidase N
MISSRVRIILCAISLLFLSIPAREASPLTARLQRTATPLHYRIDLKPDLKALRSEGSEIIDLKVTTPTSKLTLNALKIAIRSAELDEGAAGEPVISMDETAQTATLSFRNSISPGMHRLRIAFSSEINPFGRGMYFVDYPAGGGRKRMIATQLEPTDARRIFPCWDEPAFKVSFELSVTVPQEFMAVSNTTIARKEPGGPDLKRVSFRATPPMSSYLFVLVAGEMERVTRNSEGTEIGVVAPAGRRRECGYALEVAATVLPYYNEYFGVKYPLPKLDLIAVPGGFGGAMENWGAITFYEGALLYDPLSSPASLKRRIFAIVAHEMAHQWFGDLVTMAWWSDLWLNEGFADWMQMKAEERFHPDWQVFLNEDHREAAMYADARVMSHPIEHQVANESEAAIAFDEITYAKGAAIVRLVENYVGADDFRAGIRGYIKEHSYANATTDDLWIALERASAKRVSAIASAYTGQAGMPLITVDERCDRDERVVALRQERFTIHYPDAPEARWQVPIDWAAPEAATPAGTYLLERQSAEVRAGACANPLKLNVSGVGYYRIKYDRATLAYLSNSIERMPPADRVLLLDNQWALLQAGRSEPADYFELVRNLKNDGQRAVWQGIIRVLERIDRLERGLEGRDAFRAYARAILMRPFGRLGWEARPGESEDDRIMRSSLITALGNLGDAEVAAEARRRFEGFLAHPSTLDPNLREAVVHVVGRTADRRIWNALHSLAHAAASARDRTLYYMGMARASDPQLIEQTLQLTLGNELSPERASEMILIVAAGEHPELALSFVRTNFAALAARRSPEFRHFFMSNLMANFAEASYARELAQFGPPHETSGGRIEALRAEAAIMEAADFRARLLPLIDSWVRSQSPRVASLQALDELASSITLYPTARSAGPMNTPSKPNAAAPPKMPMKTSSRGTSPLSAIRIGRSTPSIRKLKINSQTVRKTAHPRWSCHASQIAAGTQITACPPGNADRRKVTKLRKRAPGTPAIMSPSPIIIA